MVIQAKIIRDCALGPVGECQVEVGLVGVSAKELQDLEDQAEGHGLHFFIVAPEAELVAAEEPPAEWAGLGAGAVSEEIPLEREASGLCCPLEPERSWDDSVCRDMTGWSEEEAIEELAKMEILTEVKRLRDEGVT